MVVFLQYAIHQVALIAVFVGVLLGSMFLLEKGEWGPLEGSSWGTDVREPVAFLYGAGGIATVGAVTRHAMGLSWKTRFWHGSDEIPSESWLLIKWTLMGIAMMAVLILVISYVLRLIRFESIRVPLVLIALLGLVHTGFMATNAPADEEPKPESLQRGREEPKAVSERKPVAGAVDGSCRVGNCSESGTVNPSVSRTG